MAHVAFVHYAISNPFIYTIIFCARVHFYIKGIIYEKEY